MHSFPFLIWQTIEFCSRNLQNCSATFIYIGYVLATICMYSSCSDILKLEKLTKENISIHVSKDISKKLSKSLKIISRFRYVILKGKWFHIQKPIKSYKFLWTIYPQRNFITPLSNSQVNVFLWVFSQTPRRTPVSITIPQSKTSHSCYY